MISKGTKRVAAAVILLLATTPAFMARAADSIYTSANERLCGNDQSTEYYGAWRCKGPSGYFADFFDEGNVVSVRFGMISLDAKNESAIGWRGAGKVFGDNLEWRMEAGRPFAVILRTWRLEENDGRQSSVEELLVSRITPEGGCRVAAIPASRPRANVVARQIADSDARSFRCEFEVKPQKR
jgi:hypothetical protein